ncbi:HAD family hydrolase [Thermostichus vulcanus]|uniref:Phosphonoacetaldehyde hydrolase n=1 Tax=Thermostichus vulcanus str. 'Rupite' TaxID=2813851 RepID=A0ABT0CEC0_THEVL|nr:hypothetical protein [Thermostichus vulcanus]MCJ2544130.1 hypothetical protein [Thermostichus vulcanus str. 'Rupite']
MSEAAMIIRLVVFDMAGTTVKDNDDVSKALIAAFAQVGIPIGITETNPVMGYPKPVAVRLLLEKHWPDAAQLTLPRLETGGFSLLAPHSLKL